jgi:hypothetical protein
MFKGAYKSCLWTGIANRQYHGTKHIDMRLKYDDQMSIIPGMPDNLWEWEDEFLALYQRVDQESMEYLSRSLLVKFSVDSVPLRPVVSEEKYPKVYASLHGMNNKLDVLVPERLSTHNAGSNIGLLKILKEISVELDGRRVKRYRVIMSDINIHDRIMKVTFIVFFVV